MDNVDREVSRKDIGVVLFLDESVPFTFEGNPIHLGWNNIYMADLAERISIRSTFMQKLEVVKVEL